ncbi:unnamed protein product, partial [marine sediment metagenome]
AVDIDIGTEALSRVTNTSFGYTYILKDNPANASGKITQIEVYIRPSPTANFKVATFYNVTGTNFSTRDSHFIGVLTSGYHCFTGLDITVKEGDYLGFYMSGGGLSMDNEGGEAYWYLAGDNIPCENVTFIVTGNTTRILSLYGTGKG